MAAFKGISHTAPLNFFGFAYLHFMKSSYKPNDVTLLLKDITGMVTPLSAKEREPLIQSGVHYSEMLPLEYRPSDAYFTAYENALHQFAKPTADAVCLVAEKIYEKHGKNVCLVSLARAGIPIGILIKHYLDKKYHLCVPHYSISIIRGKGIDTNAISYLLKNHAACNLQFVDGWIGKGAILNTLNEALSPFKGISSELAVLSDPANITDLCGTHEDLLIPSSCLNSTVSGLVSRTFLRPDIIGEHDFHGAAYYKELASEDVSYEFINAIEQYFDFSHTACTLPKGTVGIEEVRSIANDFSVSDINFIKPGIGEATRVLLRRIPYCLLIREGLEEDPRLIHLIRLAKEKQVLVKSYPLKNYIACGIIRQLADI